MDSQQQEVSFGMVMEFLKPNRWRLLFFAIFSLGIIILLGGLIYLILPSDNFLAQQIQIMLPRSGANNNPVYPNKKPFNRLDIISPPVLKQVYEQNGLDKFLSFKDFQKKLGVVNFSQKRAFLEAEFASKLSKRNLSATDLAELERSYREAEARIDDNIYKIIIRQDSFPPHLADKVLGGIVQAWYEIYRDLESDKLPTSNINSDIEQKMHDNLGQSRLLALDHLSDYVKQLDEFLKQLQEILNNRSLSLPSGEYIGDLQIALQYIKRYQDMLQQMVVDSQSLQSSFDTIYLQSRIQNVQFELDALQSKRQMLLEWFEMVQGRTSGGEKKAHSTEMTSFTIDSTVLNQLADLYRRDAINKIRSDISSESVELGDTIATVSAQLSHYQKMLERIQQQQKQQADVANQELFNSIFNKTLQNTVSLSRKVLEFRKLLTDEYFSSLEFYTPVGGTALFRERSISLRWLIMISGLIWLLGNLFYIGSLIVKNYNLITSPGKSQHSH